MFAAEHEYDDIYLDQPPTRIDIGITCNKRVYTSAHAARNAHRRAHYRVRVFWCSDCRGYHVTNNEKR